MDFTVLYLQVILPRKILNRLRRRLPVRARVPRFTDPIVMFVGGILVSVIVSGVSAIPYWYTLLGVVVFFALVMCLVAPEGPFVGQDNA